jgi:hypothetical protein
MACSNTSVATHLRAAAVGKSVAKSVGRVVLRCHTRTRALRVGSIRHRAEIDSKPSGVP